MISIIGLAITVLLAVWVSKDSKKRGMNVTVWVVVCVLLGLIGAIIYLIARKPIQEDNIDTDSFGKPEADDGSV